MTRRSIPPLMLVACLSACATGPTLTLLPSEEGKQGAVAVLEENGKPVDYVVTELNSSTNLSGRPKTRAINPDKLNARRLALLQALPPPPVRLRLYFQQGTTRLTPESQPGLDFLKKEVAERPGAEVQVTGHTDTVGKLEDNDVLSERRAEEVVKALAELGIEPVLLTAVGRGERDPLEDKGDNAPSQANRRVEVIVR
jgi:outer membrane protein OmpA-like peptidoglycan-associated protein